MKIRRHKHWGWGDEDQQPSDEQLRAIAVAAGDHLGLPVGEIEAPVALEDVVLASPRVAPPAALSEICAADVHSRASHALGKSYCDVVDGFRGRFAHPPDFVARPREERDVERLIEWCAAERVAAIPFGGGTSVVGGVTPDVPSSYNGAITLDLRALDRVREVDAVSRAALIDGGASGPALERELGRARPDAALLPAVVRVLDARRLDRDARRRALRDLLTHIEDFVESVRAITPAGAWESRRLPGSGAGPSPDRMLAGSEGAFGVITQAWMRVQPRPAHRARPVCVSRRSPSAPSACASSRRRVLTRATAA